MTVGICTRYDRHEAAFAAINVGNALRGLGHNVSMLSFTPVKQLDHYWDKCVIPHKRKSFSEFTSDCDCVVWTTLPHIDQLRWVKSQGKKTVLIPMWCELTHTDGKTLGAFDRIITPTRACYVVTRQWGLKSSVYVPWAITGPLFSKPANYEIKRLKVLMPLWDGNVARTEYTAIHALLRMLTRYTNVEATVAYTSSTISLECKQLLKRARRRLDGRLHIDVGTLPAQRPVLFQRHDVTYCPYHYSNTNLVELLSYSAGTPIIGFDDEPMSELLDPNISVPVKCWNTSYNAISVPMVQPDYWEMDDSLMHIGSDFGFIRYLQSNVLDKMQQRQLLFHNQLAKVFTLCTQTEYQK